VGHRTHPEDRIRVYDRAASSLPRREMLRILSLSGAAFIVSPASRQLRAQTPSAPVLGAYPFTLGVASGDPIPDGVVLWTRLAPKPFEGGGMPAVRFEVAWEIAADESFRTIVQKGIEIARPELGHSVHADVRGLNPGREYFYRFHAAGDTSPVGRTVTAPAEGAAVDRLRFAVCGCSHLETGFFTAYRHIADERFDFVFHTGDYIYEGRGDAYRGGGRVRHHHGEEIYTLVDYRNRYAQYKMDRDLAAAHASAPFIVSWDDHEVDNDYAGHLDEQDTPSEYFMLRRAAAYQAYYENMPLRAGSLPAGPHLRLHRRLTFGNLIDFSVLDTRQHRSKQACGGGSRTGCEAVNDPARTLLGNEQERWLFEQLAQARATWTVLGQQIPTYARDFSGANPDAAFAMDKWDGYAVSRHRLYARLLETRAPNPVILSGDVHLHYAAELKMDYADPQSASVGVEFTNTSITSNGDGTDVTETWERLKADNPHIKYHSARRGYVACTATADAMRADFKVLDRVTIPYAPVRSGGSYVVEAGRRTITQ